MPISLKRQIQLQLHAKSTLPPIFLLFLLPALLYGKFLWNPVVFDDQDFFNGTIHKEYLGKIFSLKLRWLPYATFEWTREFLGLNLIWFHLENLALHIANSTALFLFLRRLFEIVIPQENAIASDANIIATLPLSWLAFFCALIFSLHPASVYAVTYLSQRSILMATFFALIMWRLFLEGIVRENQYCLIASAVAYFFAVFSKEHTVMAPAVAAAIALLLRQPSQGIAKLIWPTFVLYGLIAILVMFEVKSEHILGQTYEVNAAQMLARLAKQDPGFEIRMAYPLSILTQSFLFFKYLLIWIIPSPAWMSVDMYEDFAKRLWSWPQIVGLIGFIAYPLAAFYLLLQRGVKGLLGFALLCPWLLFITEFSTVRIQESFVIYRSYFWIIGLFSAMPFVVQKVPAKHAAIALIAIALVMIPTAWFRLITFSHPLLLWDDAARLVEDKTDRPGVERIYYNRGQTLFRLAHYEQAIKDYDKALSVYPEYSYAYNGRGAAYLELKQYQRAMSDFDKTIELNPRYFPPFIGRGLVYEKLNNLNAARWNYRISCLMGSAQGCRQFKELSNPP
ncbi:tetratricopeptide repeat protein [Collimonas sp. NPDC087041]|uniref:tetratricopeptide repeat protein n=1 Tax=Collimonas sp. NPDC087041 TaxID=3363960 RepID=UPI0038138D1D